MLEGCGNVFAANTSHFLTNVTAKNLVEGGGFFANRVELFASWNGVQVGPLE